MKNAGIKEILLEHIDYSSYIQINRDKIDDDSLSCIPLSIGKTLLFIKFYNDFSFDGYKILRIKDLTDVRYNATDQFFEEILIKEGLIVDEHQFVVNKLDHWKDTFLELKTIDKNIIIELEDYNGHGLSFFIGKIIEIDNDSIYFHNFNSIGEWDENPVKILYKDISLVSFDDRYSRIISKYVK
jgi:hypothetical protein